MTQFSFGDLVDKGTKTLRDVLQAMTDNRTATGFCKHPLGDIDAVPTFAAASSKDIMIVGFGDEGFQSQDRIPFPKTEIIGEDILFDGKRVRYQITETGEILTPKMVMGNVIMKAYENAFDREGKLIQGGARKAGRTLAKFVSKNIGISHGKTIDESRQYELPIPKLFSLHGFEEKVKRDIVLLGLLEEAGCVLFTTNETNATRYIDVKADVLANDHHGIFADWYCTDGDIDSRKVGSYNVKRLLKSAQGFGQGSIAKLIENIAIVPGGLNVRKYFKGELGHFDSGNYQDAIIVCEDLDLWREIDFEESNVTTDVHIPIIVRIKGKLAIDMGTNTIENKRMYVYLDDYGRALMSNVKIEEGMEVPHENHWSDIYGAIQNVVTIKIRAMVEGDKIVHPCLKGMIVTASREWFKLMGMPDNVNIIAGFSKSRGMFELVNGRKLEKASSKFGTFNYIIAEKVSLALINSAPRIRKAENRVIRITGYGDADWLQKVDALQYFITNKPNKRLNDLLSFHSGNEIKIDEEKLDLFRKFISAFMGAKEPYSLYNADEIMDWFDKLADKVKRTKIDGQWARAHIALAPLQVQSILNLLGELTQYAGLKYRKNVFDAATTGSETAILWNILESMTGFEGYTYKALPLSGIHLNKENIPAEIAALMKKFSNMQMVVVNCPSEKRGIHAAITARAPHKQGYAGIMVAVLVNTDAIKPGYIYVQMLDKAFAGDCDGDGIQFGIIDADLACKIGEKLPWHKEGSTLLQDEFETAWGKTVVPLERPKFEDLRATLVDTVCEVGIQQQSLGHVVSATRGMAKEVIQAAYAIAFARKMVKTVDAIGVAKLVDSFLHIIVEPLRDPRWTKDPSNRYAEAGVDYKTIIELASKATTAREVILVPMLNGTYMAISDGICVSVTNPKQLIGIFPQGDVIFYHHGPHGNPNPQWENFSKLYAGGGITDGRYIFTVFNPKLVNAHALGEYDERAVVDMLVIDNILKSRFQRCDTYQCLGTWERENSVTESWEINRNVVLVPSVVEIDDLGNEIVVKKGTPSWVAEKIGPSNHMMSDYRCGYPTFCGIRKRVKVEEVKLNDTYFRADNKWSLIGGVERMTITIREDQSNVKRNPRSYTFNLNPATCPIRDIVGTMIAGKDAH